MWLHPSVPRKALKPLYPPLSCVPSQGHQFLIAPPIAPPPQVHVDPSPQACLQWELPLHGCGCMSALEG